MAGRVTVTALLHENAEIRRKGKGKRTVAAGGDQCESAEALAAGAGRSANRTADIASCNRPLSQGQQDGLREQADAEVDAGGEYCPCVECQRTDATHQLTAGQPVHDEAP